MIGHLRRHLCQYDAIIRDLYEGPHHAKDSDPLYGNESLRVALSSLSKEGVFSVWSEEPDQAFEKRLDRMRSPWKKQLAGRGDRRYPVYLIEGAAEVVVTRSI